MLLAFSDLLFPNTAGVFLYLMLALQTERLQKREKKPSYLLA